MIDKLGYYSEMPETRNFSGELDLREGDYGAIVAMLVDDYAELGVQELVRNADVPVEEPVFHFNYKAGKDKALWHPNAYSEFLDHPIPPGRKYRLTVYYRNKSNFTENIIYAGRKDYDGMSVYLSLIKLDLDIDSDNNNGYGPPDGNAYEDSIEASYELEGSPYYGKLVGVTSGDLDRDGVPDSHDAHIATNTAHFTQVRLHLPTGLDTNATLSISYPTTNIILWTKDAHVARTPLPLTRGGDVLAPSTYRLYDLRALAPSGTNTFYLQGRAPATNQTIRVSVDPDGPTGPASFAFHDTVNLTIIEVDLDVDSDNNNALDDPSRSLTEEALEDEPGHPGKALALNHLDRDKDGVPDFADGFDIEIGGVSQSAADASHDFVPVIFEFSEGIDTNTATVKFSGDFLSNPATDVDVTGAGTKEDPFVYSIVGDGRVRLWRGKNGSDSRLKACVTSGGDAILKDEVIPLTSLSPSNGVVRLYLEALKRSDTLGDIQIKVELNPTGSGVAADYICSDQVKATVFGVDSVHPIRSDFATDQEGKVLISAKHGGGFHTTNLTTVAGSVAQFDAAQVTISAYVLPLPPAGYTNLTVYFEVTDPDDLSHYEGKTVPGTPTVQGDENPNDNRDPAKRMTTGTGDDYTLYQAACLSARFATPAITNIAGTTRAVAETTLQITGQHSGDNYQVRATMQKPHNLEPFDKRSSWTTNDVHVTSSIKESETMIAWKRVYIEQDNMYTNGATITANAAVGATNLTVDSTADFTVGDSVVVFWTNGTFNTTITATNAGTVTIADGLPQAITPYAGIRPQVEPGTYTVDRRYLPDAFGRAPDGSDGGAFIEFLDAPTGSGDVPKYTVFPDYGEAFNFARYWFRNYDNRGDNVLQLIAATKTAGGTSGVAQPNWSICIIHVVYCQPHSVFRDEVVVHEIGHRFDLVQSAGGQFSYIDTYADVKNHAVTDYCIMSYNKTWNNGKAEYSLQAILSGSSSSAGDALRDRVDN